VVVALREGGAMRLAAADERALGLGLKPGLALADARARVPELVVHEHEPEADLKLLSRIADWCDRYTPLIGEEPAAGLVLEVAGSVHLFGGEANLVADLTRRLGRFGFTCRAAVAGTSTSARALARFGDGGITPPGEERQFCALLPVAALELDLERTVALRRAGLFTIADLAARPRKPLAARFGADLVERLSAMLGESDPPLVPRRPVPDFISERRFAEPIGLVDDIAIALDELAADLCGLLERHGRGGRIFEATFYRADGATRRIEAMSGRPLREPKALAKLFMTRLDALADPVDPGFGFDMIRLGVRLHEEANAAQVSLDRESAEAETLANLVDRLTARFGAASVERFVPRDSHMPEHAARRVPAVSARQAVADWPDLPQGEPATRPILFLSPPQPVETVAEVPDGPPFRFRWRRVLHEVAHAEGPERIAPEWWRGTDTLSRDYYRVEDREGRRFWLFRQGVFGRETAEPAWYVHGLFP
jgi:protein ImuB